MWRTTKYSPTVDSCGHWRWVKPQAFGKFGMPQEPSSWTQKQPDQSLIKQGLITPAFCFPRSISAWSLASQSWMLQSQSCPCWKRGKNQSYDQPSGSPRGEGNCQSQIKTVLFHRKLLYLAVLIFLNNYCKNIYICWKCLLRPAPPGRGRNVVWHTWPELLEPAYQMVWLNLINREIPASEDSLFWDTKLIVCDITMTAILLLLLLLLFCWGFFCRKK